MDECVRAYGVSLGPPTLGWDQAWIKHAAMKSTLSALLPYLPPPKESLESPAPRARSASQMVAPLQPQWPRFLVTPLSRAVD
jgi:hypothetical protein